jgi:hypothetical protein
MQEPIKSELQERDIQNISTDGQHLCAAADSSVMEEMRYTMLSLGVFSWYSSAPSYTPGYYLKIGHDCFLPHPFQFISHL